MRGMPGIYTPESLQPRIYIDHDVMHGATFPVYEWQRFLTHPFADFFSLPWEEFVLEHNRQRDGGYGDFWQKLKEP